MPLTPQDQAYWKKKLGWNSFFRIAVTLIIVGCVIWPLVLFTLSWSQGHAGDWTWALLMSQVEGNFMLAILVSTLIWCIGQVYFYMDWLPPQP